MRMGGAASTAPAAKMPQRAVSWSDTHWYMPTREWLNVARRLQGGETLEEVVTGLPLAPLVMEAGDLLERALGMFERLDDRSGVMSTIIAMALAVQTSASLLVL